MRSSGMTGFIPSRTSLTFVLYRNVYIKGLLNYWAIHDPLGCLNQASIVSISDAPLILFVCDLLAFMQHFVRQLSFYYQSSFRYCFSGILTDPVPFMMLVDSSHMSARMHMAFARVLMEDMFSSVLTPLLRSRVKALGEY